MDTRSLHRSRAEILFAELLVAEPQPSEERVRVLCESHPELATELLRMHAELVALRGIFSAPAGAAGASAPDLGAFRCLRLLGRGGMGEVWEAEDHALGRKVAVKLLRESLTTSAVGLQRFQREAQAAGRAQHPGLVAVHQTGEWAGRRYLVQELVPGGRTLRDEIEELRKLPEVPAGQARAAAARFERIADALVAAHAAGVVHRDIKPQNVLLTADGTPKVADFGLALLVDDASLSLTGEFVGTYFYASPEQMRGDGRSVDERTDVFSLGATLYEVLTLRRAFDGDSAQEITRAVLDMDPAPPHVVRGRIPLDLSLVCMKALEKRPQDRYQSMAELRDDLRRFLAHEPIRARAPSAPRRALKWSLRHPTAATALCLSFASSVALTGLFLHSARQARLATARADDVLRLSALQDLEALIARADALWPPHPKLIAAYDAWLAEAEALVLEIPRHAAKHAELRAQPHAEEQNEVRWWDAQLTKLIAGLEALQAGLLSPDALTPDRGWSIPRRRAIAQELRADFGPDGRHAGVWEHALPAIHAAYPVLALAAQPGLLPLGPDPASGLWEFAHLVTGEPAVRGADGKLTLREETGIVLVLIPAGTYRMGAQSLDPGGENHDPQAQDHEGPVHEVELSAYFLSKHEMTQAQWQRLTGRNPSDCSPSTYKRGWDRHGRGWSALHPVEQVSWLDCMAWLPRVDLALPSEAQWERGCRGGTASVYWSGDELESLQGVANVADAYCKDNSGGQWTSAWEPRLDDGSMVHAEVGSFLANPFGLHDVHGNVWELCLDGLDAAFYAQSLDRDPVHERMDGADCVVRGGGFDHPALDARSATRVPFKASSAINSIGVRPARPVTE